MSSSSQSDPLLSGTDPSSLSDPSSSSSSPSSSTSKSSNSSSNSSTAPKSATDNTSQSNSGTKSTTNTTPPDGKSTSNSSSPPGSADLSTLNPSGSTTGTTPLTGGTTGTTAGNTGSSTGNTGSSTGETGSGTGGRTSTSNGNPISPAPDTTTTSTTIPPSRTSTTAVPSSTVPTPSSVSTSIPSSSSSAASATHTSSTLSMITSTNVPSPTVVLSTFTPSATGLPTSSPSGAPSEGSSTNLIGPIIGGIAGGLVGIILLTWLILIPIRRRAEQRKEVDWMPFGSDNDHLNDSGNDSLYRTPRSGVAETETKPMDSPDMYQMSDIGSNANHNENMGSLYSHLDRNTSHPSRSTHPGAQEGYMVANDVVGDMPASHYPPAQPPVYYSHALAAQQQQQMYANYGAYSPNTSPEMAARRFVGQENGWVQSSASNQGHSGASPLLRSQKSFNHPQAHSMNPHEAHGLNRNPSGGSAPAYISPQHTHAMPAPLPHGMHKQVIPPQGSSPSPDFDDDSQLAYAQDAIGTPRPEHGQLSHLHVVNNGSH